MRNIFILLVGCLLLAACGSTPENRSNAVANSTNIPAERPAANTNAAANANAERTVEGVKIEKPETEHFEAATLPGGGSGSIPRVKAGRRNMKPAAADLR